MKLMAKTLWPKVVWTEWRNELPFYMDLYDLKSYKPCLPFRLLTLFENTISQRVGRPISHTSQYYFWKKMNVDQSLVEWVTLASCTSLCGRDPGMPLTFSAPSTLSLCFCSCPAIKFRTLYSNESSPRLEEYNTLPPGHRYRFLPFRYKSEASIKLLNLFLF
jgi:hypothetical protein